MSELDQYISYLQTPAFLGILLMMFSTFIIGYFSGVYLQQTKKRKLIERLKKEVNSLKTTKNVTDIETIFTEIKPKIIQVLKESQENEYPKRTNEEHKEKIVEKTRSEYVSYSHPKPTLDFERIGYGDKYSPDPLTEINGIGPYIEEKLNEIGIYNYNQISRLKLKDIRDITHLIDFFPGRIERDDWVGQAKAIILTN